MPFIDADFLLDETTPAHQLLITSADDSDVLSVSFELAKILQKTEQSILWIDGNLGERLPFDFPESPEIEQVILGEIPVTHALQSKDNITVLTGKAKHCLAECSEILQFQFLQDLRTIYPHFDKVIICIDGKNPTLQKKWLNETKDVYLLFNAKNLLLNRTITWLNENKNLAKGLIGIGKNDQEVLLSYMRIKEIIGEVSELILDIKKIAP